MNRKIKFIDLGLMDYKEAWDFQQKLFELYANVFRSDGFLLMYIRMMLLVKLIIINQ